MLFCLRIKTITGFLNSENQLQFLTNIFFYSYDNSAKSSQVLYGVCEEDKVERLLCAAVVDCQTGIESFPQLVPTVLSVTWNTAGLSVLEKKY